MKFMHQIATIALMFIVLFASIGVTLNKHYCMGHLVSIALYEEAESCMDIMGMEDEESDMHCCDDVHEEYKVEEPGISPYEFEFKADIQFYHLVSFLILHTSWPAEDSTPPNYALYKPPNIDQDIPVLVQSFLI